MRARLAVWAGKATAPVRALLAVLARRARLTLVVAAILAVASMAAAVVVWLSIDEEKDSERIQEARESAEVAAVRLFSFGQATLDDDLAKAKAVLTRELAGTFDLDIAAPTREQVAASPGIESRVIVSASGVTSEASEPDVSVLIHFNRTIRTPDQPQAQTISFAALLRMHEQDGRWLVADALQF